MTRFRDRMVAGAAVVAAAAAAGFVAGGRLGEALVALCGLALPPLVLAAGGPARPRWLLGVYAALGVDLVASGALLLLLRSADGARVAGWPAALVVQVVGFWLVPFLLTATAALLARRQR